MGDVAGQERVGAEEEEDIALRGVGDHEGPLQMIWLGAGFRNRGKTTSGSASIESHEPSGGRLDLRPICREKGH